MNHRGKKRAKVAVIVLVRHYSLVYGYVDTRISRTCTPSTAMKQVGLAEWSKCRLSHLGVAGSIPGHEDL